MAGERIADHQIMEIQEQNWRRVMSPEIVELEDHEIINHRTRDDVVVVESIGDVFVAVGKNDLDVVKWAVDHLVSAGARLYLVHVFPPVTHIQTPVGKLSRSQLSKDQVQIYVNEENNKRRSLLQKYIRLCTDAKVAVETMLLESNATTKAILDLIHVVNITKLVMGTKRAPSLRRLRKGSSKSELVKKNAPDFCDVSVIYNGKPVMADQQRHVVSDIPTTSQNGLKTTPFSSERKFFECACFSRNFDS
ncbi:U-box domain-containing protein 36-like [Cynara cardunculus var. scolymus]|uniref:U-box domain-containing protein 36-like n=1 Tax=Cynara cardunculus var. scolymus TaxID=59895 RepID=UPI000D629FF5|nr:U-box domain-containing protein 36-like [Cynara cardunculus var. scolymus]